MVEKWERNIHIHLKIILIDFESEKFKNATRKFHKLFNVPADEKLVTCKQQKLFLFFIKASFFLQKIDYSCSYWRGRVPRQGWLYLSVNYLCFYSYLLGKDISMILKFTDITVCQLSDFIVMNFCFFSHSVSSYSNVYMHMCPKQFELVLVFMFMIFQCFEILKKRIK